MVKQPSRDQRERSCLGLPLSVRRAFHRRQQPRVTGAAHRQARAIRQSRQAAVFAIGLDPRHPLQVDESGTMDPHKARGIELCFQLRDGLLLQIALPAECSAM